MRRIDVAVHPSGTVENNTRDRIEALLDEVVYIPTIRDHVDLVRQDSRALNVAHDATITWTTSALDSTDLPQHPDTLFIRVLDNDQFVVMHAATGPWHLGHTYERGDFGQAVAAVRNWLADKFSGGDDLESSDAGRPLEERAEHLAVRLLDELGDVVRILEELALRSREEIRERDATIAQLKADIDRLKAELARRTPRLRYLKLAGAGALMALSAVSDIVSINSAISDSNIRDSVVQMIEACDEALGHESG